MRAKVLADVLLFYCMLAMRELLPNRAVFGIVQLCRRGIIPGIYLRVGGDALPHTPEADIISTAINCIEGEGAE